METAKNLMTANEVLLANKLNWTVSANPIYDNNGKELTQFKAIQRDDNGQVFQVSKNRYRVLQNNEALSILDEVVGSGFAKYSEAKSFKNGAVVMVRAEVPSLGYQISGDDIKTSIHVATSHDGSMSTFIFASSQRLICKNLLTVNMRRDINTLKVKHTENYRLKLNDFQTVFAKYREVFQMQKKQYEEMVRKPMNSLELDFFLSKLFEDDEKELLPVRVANQKDKVKYLYYHGIGHETLNNSYWKAYQAVTQFVSHEKSARNGEIEQSSYFGSGSKLREKAYQLLK